MKRKSIFDIVCTSKFYDTELVEKILNKLEEYLDTLEENEPLSDLGFEKWSDKIDSLADIIYDLQCIVDNYDAYEQKEIQQKMDSLIIFQLEYKGIKRLKLD